MTKQTRTPRRRAGVIRAAVTASACGGTGEAQTSPALRRKRRYTPRARTCKCCKTVFTPTQKTAKYCSTHCRLKAWRKRQPKPKREPELTPITCEHCGLGYLVPAGMGRASARRPVAPEPGKCADGGQ